MLLLTSALLKKQKKQPLPLNRQFVMMLNIDFANLSQKQARH